MKKIILLIAVGMLLIGSGFYNKRMDTSHILSYEVDPKHQELKFYWKNDAGKPYKSFEALKSELENENKKLVFATNGGMYMRNGAPLGLFIENHIAKKSLNKTQNAYGNFYMQPNGVFYLNNTKEAVVCSSKNYKANSKVQYASQSGPMLLIDGEMHPKFKKGSSNLNIRNGVGILPNGNILFAMSKKEINFYDFANYFKQHGCKNALYLDGVVSRTYLPAKNWIQTDGDFGVIIAVTENKQ